MSPRDAFDPGTKHEKLCRTDAALDTMAADIHSDPAKARVMTYLRRLVVEGFAEWQIIENGDIRFRFHTGETYLLAKTMIIRIA